MGRIETDIQEKANEIFSNAKTPDRTNRYPITIKEFQILSYNGGSIKEINKEVGNCYRQICRYREKDFYCITGRKIEEFENYNAREKRFEEPTNLKTESNKFLN